METSTIVLPVSCPHCLAVALAEFPVIVVRAALGQWNHMALYGNCACQPWDASPAEMRGIRSHLGADWV